MRILAIYKTMNNIQQYKTLSVWVDVPPKDPGFLSVPGGAVYTPYTCFWKHTSDGSYPMLLNAFSPWLYILCMLKSQIRVQ